MPSLRCLIGPSPTSLTAIPVNSSTSHYISSDLWEGNIAVFVKFDTPPNSRRGSRKGSRKNSPNGSPVSEKGRSKKEKEKFTFETESGSHEYFERSERSGVTWSIQVQGLSFLPMPSLSIFSELIMIL